MPFFGRCDGSSYTRPAINLCTGVTNNQRIFYLGFEWWLSYSSSRVPSRCDTQSLFAPPAEPVVYRPLDCSTFVGLPWLSLALIGLYTPESSMVWSTATKKESFHLISKGKTKLKITRNFHRNELENALVMSSHQRSRLEFSFTHQPNLEL